MVIMVIIWGVLTFVLFSIGSELGWEQGALSLSKTPTCRAGTLRNKRTVGQMRKGRALRGGCVAQALGLEDTQHVPTLAVC